MQEGKLTGVRDSRTFQEPDSGTCSKTSHFEAVGLAHVCGWAADSQCRLHLRLLPRNWFDKWTRRKAQKCEELLVMASCISISILSRQTGMVRNGAGHS